MGQAMSSETLSISGGDGHRYWVGLTMKPSHVGDKKTIYKGVLLGNGPRQWEKVVAKAFTHIPGTKESWIHEVNKADVTKQLAAKFIQDHLPPCKIRVVMPGIVQMDKVSNVNKWLAGKSGARALTRDEWISIEELIPGTISRFCPWKADHVDKSDESKHLQTFSHYTFKETKGALVICDFQGKCNHKNSVARYIFTDSIIHSSCKLYGLFDNGEYGITEFFKFHKCTDICKDWPRPTPLTPPPSFDEACIPGNFNLTPPPAFENIVFPSHSSELTASGQEPEEERNFEWSRRRHASDRQRRWRAERETGASSNVLSVDWQAQRKRSHSSSRLDDEEVQISCPLPFYGNVPSLQDSATSNEPPSYDSLVACADSSEAQRVAANGLSTEAHRGEEAGAAGGKQSPHLHRPHSGSLKHLQGGRERSKAYHEMRQPHRSSTDSDLEQEGKKEDYSALFKNMSRSPSSLQQRRLLSAASDSDDGATPVFYLENVEAALPPLIVPSAPPLEDEAINGT